MTEQQYHDWLDSASAIRLVLVEVNARVSGVETTRYLSTGPYVTGAGDAPAHQPYRAILIADDIVTNEQLSTSGEASMTVGEIGIGNQDGSIDSWLLDVWTNRQVKIFLGDPRWPRADFQLVFDGIVANIGSKSRTTLSLKVRDKLQRLNGAVSEVKLGGETTNKDALLPLLFGEAHNLTPLLVNPAQLEYQFHIGAAERIIEVRDNGVPVSHTPNLAAGKFRLNQSPAGAVTVSAQGAKPNGIYNSTVAGLVTHLVTSYGKAEDRFDAAAALAPGLYPAAIIPTLKTYTRTTTATYKTDAGSVATAAANEPRVQGGQLVMEAGATNLVRYSEQLDNPAWTTGAQYILTPNAALAPNGLMEADRIVPAVGTISSDGNVTRQAVTVSAGLLRYTVSAFIKRVGQATSVKVWPFIGTQSVRNAYVIFDLITGAIILNPDQQAGFENLVSTPAEWFETGGFWRVNLSFTVTIAPGLITPRFMPYVGLNPLTGDGTSGIYVWGVMLTQGGLSSYIPTNGTIVTREPDEATQYTDIDVPNLVDFGAEQPQPVGLPLLDRTNVLAACQQLAASIGAQVTVSRLGKLQLLRIDLQNLVPTYSIKPEHMRERALSITAYSDVQAAVKLGFCKNWTMQPGLQTSLSAADKELFNTEWLTTTQIDEDVRATYRLTAEPVQDDTLLLRRVDAEPEALRRLELRKVPRTTFQFEGYAPMMRLQLGQTVELTHPRFNLQDGKAGMVVSLSVRWAKGRATVGVMT